MLTKIPNMLTIARIAAIPVLILALIFLDAPLANWLAFGVYTVACITDFFAHSVKHPHSDGFLTRLPINYW